LFFDSLVSLRSSLSLDMVSAEDRDVVAKIQETIGGDHYAEFQAQLLQEASAFVQQSFGVAASGLAANVRDAVQTSWMAAQFVGRLTEYAAQLPTAFVPLVSVSAAALDLRSAVDDFMKSATSKDEEKIHSHVKAAEDEFLRLTFGGQPLDESVTQPVHAAWLDGNYWSAVLAYHATGSSVHDRSGSAPTVAALPPNAKRAPSFPQLASKRCSRVTYYGLSWPDRSRVTRLYE
jgi:hypothetical protein